MKKFSAFMLVAIIMLSLFGCKAKTPKITLNDFEKVLNSQPLVIVENQMVVQTSNATDKQFYPDMLTSIFQNRTNKVIDYVKIAFVAWDKYGNPVRIKSKNESKADEIKLVQYKQLNLESGRYYGKSIGIELDSSHNIASFKTIVVSFKTKDGEEWQNPYFDIFKSIFVTKKFDKSIMIEFERQEDIFKTLSKNELDKTRLDETALKQKLEELPIQILSSEYIIRGEEKDSTPDVIKTLFKNNGEKEIKEVNIALFGFDESGKAVKLKEAGDNAFEGNYLALVGYTTKGFVKDVVFGENDLYQIHENCGVKYVVAIVKSYIDIDDEIYENPYFADLCFIYEGGEIEVELPTPPEGAIQ